MPERISPTIEDPDLSRAQSRERSRRIESSLAAANEGAGEEVPAEKIEEFLERESEILAAYGMKGDIRLERGKGGWKFDFEHRRLIYDPEFFRERGYDLKETLFATTHELMAHYGELLRDPETVLKEAKRYTARPQLHILHNIFEDVLGNRRIVAEMPFLEETREALYREKLFPQTDYRDMARHVQFAYGFIRDAMVPGEETQLAPEVEEALAELRQYGSKGIDVLDLVTTPEIDPKERFQIMRKIIEPIYLSLYREDVKEGKQNAKGQGQPQDRAGAEGQPSKDEPSKTKEQGEEKKGFWRKKKPSDERQDKSESGEGKSQGKKEGEGGERPEDGFKKQYKVYEDGHPEPLSPQDQERLQKTIQDIAAKRGGVPSLDRAILEQWAREHGVNPEDVLGYRKEYEEVAPLIAELREVFKSIVSRRLKERWRMSPQLQKEGEELDEGALAEAYAESKAGGEARAFRDLARRPRESKGYGMLDMTLINDLSGSMGEGAKLPMDRKSKVLFLESLADFQKEIKNAEYESGMPLGLEVRTETRAFGDFGDAELKALSPDLSEKDRILIWKKLHQTAGGTPDYLSLETVAESLTPEYVEELKQKTRRKVVAVLSDGESGDQERVQKALKELRSKGVITFALGMTDSGAAVKETYAPDAEVIANIGELPEAVQKLILKYTQDL